jgi:hypothetical protein
MATVVAIRHQRVKDVVQFALLPRSSGTRVWFCGHHTGDVYRDVMKDSNFFVR